MALPLAGTICGAVFYMLPASQSAMSTPNLWLSVGIPIICYAPVFVAFFGIWHGQRRIKRSVLAAQGRACINCVHDLRGLGETGTCPECGHAFDVAADSRRWERVKMLP
jgi:ABC-type nitrate/sulfonate/bicarbonate transport system permease component